jgi:hypothetical protein
MFALILPLFFIAFIISVTWLSYKLGTTKSDNAKLCAIIGFLLSFLPPFALIYLMVLLLKEDSGIV